MLKKKIAILITSMHAGGAERMVSHLLAGLRDDYEIHLLLFSDEIEYDLPEDQKISFLDRNDSRRGDARNIFRIPLIAHRLVNYCDANEIDLVLALLPRPNFVACFAKKLGLKARVLISERVYTPLWYKKNTLRGRIGRFLVSSLYPLADAILPNSLGTARALQGEFGVTNEYIIVNNFIALDDIARQKDATAANFQFDSFTFVCIGRFVEQKNHRLLLRAFAKLSGQARLLLIGKGPLMDDIRGLAASLGIQERVTFLGRLSNPFPYLRRSDCLVLPSDFEGFPNVLLEALACGVPVISTDCRTGPRDILFPFLKDDTGQMTRYGKFGVLVAAGNLVQLAEAMETVMSDSDLRKELALDGPKRAADFDKKKVIGSYREILDRFLKK